MPLYVLPSLVSWVFLLGLGIFVIMRNPKSLVNMSFATGLFGSALMQFSYCGLLLTKGFIWTKFALVGACIIPISLGIFSLTFARSNYKEGFRKWKIVLIGIAGISLWFLYLGLSGALITKTTQLSFNRFEVYTIQPAGEYFLYFLFFSILFILHNLENTYRHASSSIRWGIKFFLLGVFGVAFFYIFLISFMLLYKIIRVEYFVAEAMILIISGLLIIFSLVRYRLMDTDVFISRQVVYNSLVLFVVGTYLITIAILGYLIKYHVISQEITQFLVVEVFIYVAIIGLAAMLLSEGIRHKVEVYISKHFYKHKYEYDEVWIAFTRSIGSNIGLHTLLPQVASSMQDIVNTDQVYIFLYDEKSDRLVLSESSVPLKSPFTISMESSLVKYFQQTPNPQVAVKIFKGNTRLQQIYHEQPELFDTLEISLCAPLRVKDNFIGILAVGAERSGEPYSYEDYALLHTIGIQAASMILNAQLTENLSQARSLETFHKFAAFMMHDLKNAVQNLSFVVQNARDYFDDPEFREDAISTISDTVNRMNTMIMTLSSVPEKLELQVSNTNIVSFLDDTLKRSKVSKLDHIHIHTDVADPSLSLPLDYYHFQSVLINLLSNAAEAITAETGDITVRISRSDQAAIISVADTGGGITQEQLKSVFTPFKTTKKKGLGIGLYQCKTIVEAHGGKIYVESEVGHGTIFRLELPLKKQGDI